MVDTVSLDTLKSAFNATTWARGTAYQRAGRATVTTTADHGTSIEGRVTGSGPRPYRTEIRLREDRRGHLKLSSACTCPVGAACKHAVAMVLQARKDGVLRLPLHDAAPPTPSKAPGDADDALSPDIEHWLRQLNAAVEMETEAYPDSIRQRLIYVISEFVWPTGLRQTQVKTLSVRVLKEGGFSTTFSPYNPANVNEWGGGAKFLRPSDRTILGRIARVRDGPGSGGHLLSGESGAAILDAILETGRARWGDLAGPVMVRGEPRAGRIHWAIADDGRQRPSVIPDDGSEAAAPLAILPLAPPWAISADPEDAGQVIAAPFTLSLSPWRLAALLAAPPLRPEQVVPVRQRLARILGEAVTQTMPESLPRPLAALRIIDAVPKPHLRIFASAMERAPEWQRFGSPAQTLYLARPFFHYGPALVAACEPGATLTRRDGDGLVQIRRDRAAERNAMKSLTDLGFTRAGARHDIPIPAAHQDDLALWPAEDANAAWLAFLLEDAPRLEGAGWTIEIAEDFPLRPVLVDGDVEVRLSEGGGSGVDWLDLSLGVMVEGERMDILPALLGILDGVPAHDLDALLAEEEDIATLSVRAADGRLLVLPFDRVRPILRALVDLLGAEAGPGVRLSALEMADLPAFEDALGVLGVGFRGGERFRTLGRHLRNAQGAGPVTLPPGFTGTLRPYQATGVAWMQILRETGLGGVLADDMGLGKTVQALAHLAIEKAEGRLDRPALVIAPTSLMGNWRAEAAQFAPDLKTLVLQGPGRKRDFDRLAAQDLVFSTYPLLVHDADILAGQDWHLLILDEAQAVKNPRTAAAKTLCRLRARHRLALTGTPVENTLGELWALYDAVSPGLLGDAKTFTRKWRTPIEKKGDTERQARLSRRLRPFLLRRTKGDVLADLPPLTDIVEHVALEADQRAIYEAIRLAMHAKVQEAIAKKGLARSRIELLEALLRLRQVCCDPRLVAGLRQAGRASRVRAAGSAKLDRLMEMLPEMAAQGRRVLLFSQFTSMLALIETAVTEAGIPHLLLTGETRNRTAVVEQFQSGTTPLFLISLKAGGVGLNLTAADTVIHYDPWWNPAVEQQATDRAHRIGQEKPVFVHRLIAEDSIEGKMQTLKDRKQALADGLYDPDGTTPFDISEEDVAFLLGEV